MNMPFTPAPILFKPVLTDAKLKKIPQNMRQEFIEHGEIFTKLEQEAGISLSTLVQMSQTTRTVLVENSNNVVRLRQKVYISSGELTSMDPTLLTEILENVDDFIRLKRETSPDSHGYRI